MRRARTFKTEVDETDTRDLTNGTRLAFQPFPPPLSSPGHQPAGAFLSLRGTSRKTKLIEIHENFIRNSEASVKPGAALHIKQFSLVFFPRVDTHADLLSVCATFPTGFWIFFTRWFMRRFVRHHYEC